jgi:hypothetical protein
MNKTNYLLLLCVNIILAMVISSCSKDDPTAPLPLPPPPSIAGSWTATLTQGSSTVVILFNLSQDLINIGGSGTNGSQVVSVSGQNHYPEVSLNFSVTGYKPFRFQGQFTSTSALSGLVNGSGFTNAVMNLTKN